MAIQETKRKIHFNFFDLTRGKMKDTSPAPTVSLDKGKLRFNRSVIDELVLDGKFVAFYYDPIRSIVGFRVREQIDQREMKTWKLVRQNKTNKCWTVQIGKLLAAIDSKELDKTYRNLPVKKYVEQSDVLARGDVYYYFKLQQNEDGGGTED